MRNLALWAWPALSLLLVVLWLHALRRLRRASLNTPSSAPEAASRLVEAEDVLKIAYSLHERGGAWNKHDLARALGVPGVLPGEAAAALFVSQWAEEDAQGAMRLTASGEARARELIRAHRLWERYLVDRKGMPMEEIHAEAHRREHEITPQEMKNLDIELGYPAWDPHGHAIPAQGARVPSPQGQPLSDAGTPGSRLRILSLDDEPAALLAQLIALGLKPGLDVEVRDRESDLLRVKWDGTTVPLAVAAARHVSVMPAPALAVPLDELPAGSRGRVVEIKGGGRHQRRMLDMGFIPGAEVNVVRKAPLGDPVAYRVKGTAVALRQEDASSILVEELIDG